MVRWAHYCQVDRKVLGSSAPSVVVGAVGPSPDVGAPRPPGDARTAAASAHFAPPGDARTAAASAGSSLGP